MIGNDLVDLGAAARESQWQRKGYLEKIYSQAEQAAIQSAENPDEYIWTLWSMKESAYKIHSRKTGERKFAPIKLVAADLHVHVNEIRGVIVTERSRYFTKTVVRKNYIYSVAAETAELLPRIYTQLYFRATLFDYKKYQAECVSHHGDYLALAFRY